MPHYTSTIQKNISFIKWSKIRTPANFPAKSSTVPFPCPYQRNFHRPDLSFVSIENYQKDSTTVIGIQNKSESYFLICGMPRSLQILFARKSSISLWRGTVEVLLFLRLWKTECLFPSRNKRHSFSFRCISSWRRFIKFMREFLFGTIHEKLNRHAVFQQIVCYFPK